MANFFDYLNWRGDLTFKRNNYNRVDISILSQLSIIDLEGLIPEYPSDKEVKLKEVSDKYFITESNKKNKIGLIIPSTILELLKRLGSTKRYSDLLVSNYFDLIDENGEEQISAFTIKINKYFRVISFSGTDDTIVGWKENLNMIYKSPVPAQLTAVKYINTMMEMYSEKFIICGHSKGGNMALYGGTHCKEQYFNRVEKIYNFDGPGVCTALIHDEDYLNRLKKVITIIPQSSVVGRLFEHKEKCEIIHSNEVGFYQHDAFSWEILGTDFILEQELTKESKAVDKKIRNILENMNDEEKENFVDGIYSVMLQTNAKNLSDLALRKRELTRAYLKLPKQKRRYIIEPVRKLLTDIVVFKFVFDSLKEYRSLENKK